MKKFFSILFLLISLPGFAQFSLSVNPDILTKNWSARWISMPDLQRQTEAVLHFRKNISLDEVPDAFVIHVSADNRYQLLVNGTLVSRGPARGDQRHWRFETVDIAEHLQPDNNVIAAVVWNFGDIRPQAQMSHETAFILMGDTEAESIANTDRSWKVWQNSEYGLIPSNKFGLNTYYVVGPGEVIDGNSYPTDWSSVSYEDDDWKEALTLEPGHPRGTGTGANWMLVPRKIPPMIEVPLATGLVRRVNGESVSFRPDEKPGILLPNTTTTLIIDQQRLVTAYPEIEMSGGKGAEVTFTYAEATVGEGETWQLPERKGHRDSIDEVIGNYDRFISNGDDHQHYSPLWWRTWRYLKVEVVTKNDTLFLDKIGGIETRYPLEAVAEFSTNYPRIDEIWKVGWRTAQLCAHETYVDCPYYEQLQYVGDTRIQALVSLYVSGDDRLVRKAITDFEDSRIPDGLTQSRYPCATEQIIPTYSLFWISMLHDYWMLRDDAAFVEKHLSGVESVLDWYLGYVTASGMLNPHPWWNFVDWAKEWKWSAETGFGGVPPGNDSHSSIFTLQLIYTLQQASELMREFGNTAEADRYEDYLIVLRDAAYKAYFDEDRGLFADTHLKESFSQHGNILAILTDAIPDYQQPALMEKILLDSSLTQATFYFRFYLNRALVKTNMHDQYVRELQPWIDMLDLGLTTFAEKPEPTRSDCHAWSASPNYEFLATICGIRPASSGFSSVSISPNMGPIRQARASMPHPMGMIDVDLVRRGKYGILATITLPEGLEGEFVFRDRSMELRAGRNRIEW